MPSAASENEVVARLGGYRKGLRGGQLVRGAYITLAQSSLTELQLKALIWRGGWLISHPQ